MYLALLYAPLTFRVRLECVSACTKPSFERIRVAAQDAVGQQYTYIRRIADHTTTILDRLFVKQQETRDQAT